MPLAFDWDVYGLKPAEAAAEPVGVSGAYSVEMSELLGAPRTESFCVEAIE